MANDDGIYEFRIIGARTPDDMPMKRLCEYLTELAGLFGEHNNVHFVGTFNGSVGVRCRVDDAARDAVRNSLQSPKRKKYINKIADMLKSDQAEGQLRTGNKETVINFAGVDMQSSPAFRGIRQNGTLDGVIIRIGGTNEEIVPVHLKDGDIHYHLRADRDTATKLAPHIFQNVRVRGDAEWTRERSGEWKLENFLIEAFEVPDTTPLSTVMMNFRAAAGSQWHKFNDPVATWLGERHADGSAC
jgi:hypothetical protein